MKAPVRIWFINTETAIYTSVSEDKERFEVVSGPEQADIIAFDDHGPQFIRESIEFKKWPEKCVSLTSDDRPSYFLPGCYSSNTKGLLTGKRTKTIPYMWMQRGGPNLFVKPAGYGNYRYLYAFKGGSTSWLRKRLFKFYQNSVQREDVCIVNSDHYYHWSIDSSYLPEKALLQQEYGDLLKQSLFFLCPRGAGSSSIRLFEVMQAGRVPVIISDNWIPIEGFGWNDFSIRIREKDISKIDGIIRANEINGERLGKKAREIYTDFFAPGPDLVLLANSLIDIQNNRNERKEKLIRFVFPVIEAFKFLKQKGYKLLKFMILKFFLISGRKFSYALNRPIEEQLQKKG